MRRKIYIQNESGGRIALNGETGITIVDSTGFGVDTAEEFADIGFGFSLLSAQTATRSRALPERCSSREPTRSPCTRRSPTSL